MYPTNDAACLSSLAQPCFLEAGSSGVDALRFYPSDPAVAQPAQPLQCRLYPPYSKSSRKPVVCPTSICPVSPAT